MVFRSSLLRRMGRYHRSDFFTSTSPKSLAVFYGANRPDYYLTEGIPLLLTTALPFAAVGLTQSFTRMRERTIKGPNRAPSPSTGSLQSHSSGANRISDLDATASWTLQTGAYVCLLVPAVLSCISHKEVRFIYPILPLLHIQAAKSLATFFDPLFSSRPRTGESGKTVYRRPYRYPLIVALFILAVNLVIATYTSQVHQRGVIDVLAFLRREHEAKIDASNPHNDPAGKARATTVAFLMPCHSTPWRSHLVHEDISAWALTCEPPVDVPLGPGRDAYLDEADVFYQSPELWLRRTMKSRVLYGQKSEKGRREWPQYIVIFEQLEGIMIDVAGPLGYKRCWRGFNTHWHDDWRRKGDVVVWCRSDILEIRGGES